MGSKFDELGRNLEGKFKFMKCSESPVLFMRFLITRLPSVFVVEDDGSSIRDVTEMIWKGLFTSDTRISDLPPPRSSFISPFSYFGYLMGIFGLLGNWLTLLMKNYKNLSIKFQIIIALGSVFAIPLIFFISSSLGYITGIIAFKLDSRFRKQHLKKND